MIPRSWYICGAARQSVRAAEWAEPLHHRFKEAYESCMGAEGGMRPPWQLDQLPHCQGLLRVQEPTELG